MTLISHDTDNISINPNTVTFMKKHYLSVAIVLALTGSMLTTSCIGNFALTHKVLDWNNKIGNKFLNELVFIAFWIIPVYEVSALADVVVFNSIEFWSGSSPLASGSRIVDGENGRYLVTTDPYGYTITPENGEGTVRFDFDSTDNSWSVSVDGGESIKLLTFTDEEHVKMIAPGGEMTEVELSADGLMAYQALAAGNTFMAAR